MPAWVVPAVAVAVVIVLVVVWIRIYNGIITADNRCDNAWQTIDAQLQRRSDLIPNLVETVRGYATHESSTLSAVTAARAAVDAAGSPEAKMEASNVLTDTLRSLFAVAENYPDLKASANFQQLQTELSDTENRISYARMSFNDMVLEYNNAIETFPGSLVAGRRFRPRAGLEAATPEARTAPEVRF